mmetsp:Transcript_72980/g.163360  ORF Transcript_72980/g.163360 Transcript_72980/m.163360 type:complete len:300 (+) Transcript_72980:596-1495(+)
MIFSLMPSNWFGEQCSNNRCTARHPYMWAAMPSTRASISRAMKGTDSCGTCSMHFWMTKFPCMFSTHSQTWCSNSLVSWTWASRGTVSKAFCTTQQPCRSLESRSTEPRNRCAKLRRCSGVPRSKSWRTTSWPWRSHASLEVKGRTASRILARSCAPASPNCCCNCLLPRWSCAIMSNWDCTDRDGLLGTEKGKPRLLDTAAAAAAAAPVEPASAPAKPPAAGPLLPPWPPCSWRWSRRRCCCGCWGMLGVSGAPGPRRYAEVSAAVGASCGGCAGSHSRFRGSGAKAGGSNWCLRTSA